MPTRERTRDKGRRLARGLMDRLGSELREARDAAGVSQEHVAIVAGLTQSRVSRTERGQRLPPRLDELAQHCAALGLRLSLKAYPDGLPVRDAAQLRLLERFRSQLGEGFEWHSEAPVGGHGDLRAWDVLLRGDETIGVDAETKLRDLQALQRRTELKWRDSGVDRIVLVVAATKHNRAILREHRAALASTFPLDTADLMTSLRLGKVPQSNGIAII
jgi:transcriptional regulator with XRE-family HTH domain